MPPRSPLWPFVLIVLLLCAVIVALEAWMEGWEPWLYTEMSRLVRVFIRAGRFSNE